MTLEYAAKQAEGDFRRADNIDAALRGIGLAKLYAGAVIAPIAPVVGVPLAVAGLATSLVGGHFTKQDKTVALSHLNAATDGQYDVAAMHEVGSPPSLSASSRKSEQARGKTT